MKFTRRNLLAMAGTTAVATPFLAKPTLLQAADVGVVAGSLPSYSKRRVGDVEVFVLLDGTIDVGPDLIVGFDRDAADRALKRQHLPPFDGTRPLPVLGHVIDTGSKKIAIDTGTFPGFSPKTGGYHEALNQAGINPSDIDTVLITHLHPDHVGGLTVDNERMFPNAEFLVSKTEWDFWYGAAADALPEQVQPFVQIARNTTSPYLEQVVLFEHEEEVLPGIQAVSMPGHTPGHAGFQLHSGSDNLLFWGDLIHLPRLQFDNPDWLVAFDMDPAQTASTRATMLDRAAADGLQVTGAHLEFPGFGYVEKLAGRYEFVPSAYDYS
ncbi:MBL fold metallo-hydrolase [uncultured Ruegeria sp.]|uniref:MBL fold metallo-hydrolase n=1 Tax=uncultured Ruegeria sp. TaxID=259304 RepID=UPI0026258D0E|nr:MBL fold metallo-hydrolase [uncultured Ruegeria sp.]